MRQKLSILNIYSSKISTTKNSEEVTNREVLIAEDTKITHTVL